MFSSSGPNVNVGEIVSGYDDDDVLCCLSKLIISCGWMEGNLF